MREHDKLKREICNGIHSLLSFFIVRKLSKIIIKKGGSINFLRKSKICNLEPTSSFCSNQFVLPFVLAFLKEDLICLWKFLSCPFLKELSVKQLRTSNWHVYELKECTKNAKSFHFFLVYYDHFQIDKIKTCRLESISCLYY